jgi:hypothetical protein
MDRWPACHWPTKWLGTVPFSSYLPRCAKLRELESRACPGSSGRAGSVGYSVNNFSAPFTPPDVLFGLCMPG